MSMIINRIAYVLLGILAYVLATKDGEKNNNEKLFNSTETNQAISHSESNHNSNSNTAPDSIESSPNTNTFNNTAYNIHTNTEEYNSIVEDTKCSRKNSYNEEELDSLIKDPGHEELMWDSKDTDTFIEENLMYDLLLGQTSTRTKEMSILMFAHILLLLDTYLNDKYINELDEMIRTHSYISHVATRKEYNQVMQASTHNEYIMFPQKYLIHLNSYILIEQMMLLQTIMNLNKKYGLVEKRLNKYSDIKEWVIQELCVCQESFYTITIERKELIDAFIKICPIVASSSLVVLIGHQYALELFLSIILKPEARILTHYISLIIFRPTQFLLFGYTIDIPDTTIMKVTEALGRLGIKASYDWGCYIKVCPSLSAAKPDKCSIM
ncbi:hypothetical protein NEOKW01_0739 [Nematocida sp. AWRm80]|nr:hypothetical protein NEOKW01_0739 [Nematocida sp. AWRm80]